MRRRLFQLVAQRVVLDLPDLVARDQSPEFFALASQPMRRRRHFLDHRRVLLRHLIHLVDRRVDLIQAGRLFLGAGGDVGDDRVDLDHLRDDAPERLAGSADHSHALIDLRGRGGNQALDLLGRLRRTLGERAHLGGDDREATAGVAGARRLDPGVQRQQVGLEGDFVDDADDFADLL